jgi:hypothetical protein
LKINMTRSTHGRATAFGQNACYTAIDASSMTFAPTGASIE